jgi:hypothetical protein
VNPEYADIPEAEVVHHAEKLGVEVPAVYQLEKRLLGIERRDHGAPAEDFRSVFDMNAFAFAIGDDEPVDR